MSELHDTVRPGFRPYGRLQVYSEGVLKTSIWISTATKSSPLMGFEVYSVFLASLERWVCTVWAVYCA
jgi:hypothetical protein